MPLMTLWRWLRPQADVDFKRPGGDGPTAPGSAPLATAIRAPPEARAACFSTGGLGQRISTLGNKSLVKAVRYQANGAGDADTD
jgi:hypothetical protein